MLRTSSMSEVEVIWLNAFLNFDALGIGCRHTQRKSLCFFSLTGFDTRCKECDNDNDNTPGLSETLGPMLKAESILRNKKRVSIYIRRIGVGR